MLKYVDTKVTFAEVPDEITLCINLSGCPCHCKGCHSPYLAEDIGTELTRKELEKLLAKNKGITCVCFMGGDANPREVLDLAIHLRIYFSSWLKTAWYSGRDTFPDFDPANFNYIKIGSYKEELGPLTSKTTNQRFYKIEPLTGKPVDITNKFWKE